MQILHKLMQRVLWPLHVWHVACAWLWKALLACVWLWKASWLFGANYEGEFSWWYIQGYQGSSFVGDMLKHMGFRDDKLKKYTSIPRVCKCPFRWDYEEWSFCHC
ncbi:hypothetical protein L1887_36221 [Cichorium endivia]|nr:hypothetical protein L1887_36221 [Cichorium endivia]